MNLVGEEGGGVRGRERRREGEGEGGGEVIPKQGPTRPKEASGSGELGRGSEGRWQKVTLPGRTRQVPICKDWLCDLPRWMCDPVAPCQKWS
jgi:hypothetical protein